MQQQFGNGETYSYTYDWKPERYYPDKVVVTLPDRSEAGCECCGRGSGIRQELP
jgi:hypothetical protein